MKNNHNFAIKAIKKKGFTLIELLAVIVILAVIALILTPQILSVIKEAKEGSLEATKKSIIKASELYVVSNIEDFTLEVGEKAYIQLSELEDGYIKSIKNTSGESCVGYVKVEKTQEDYDYMVYLDCGNGENLLVDSSYVNYGGDYLDEFYDVIETSDGGYLAVGYSNSTTFSDNTRYGDTLNYDAIIVKYDSNGLEEWSHNFGGTSNDYFYSVVNDGSGYVVVGSSTSQDEDMADMGDKEATIGNSILVKYNYNGIIINKKIVTNATSSTESVARKILYSDGYYYIIGYGRNVLSSGNNLQYSIKLDSNFDEIWKNTYGGKYYALAMGGLLDSNGNIILVGYSQSIDGDMTDIKIGAKGNSDATMLIVDSDDGSIINKAIFGGTDGAEVFYDAIEVSDGYIVVGYSSSNDTDMSGLSKGLDDAIVVKFSKGAEAAENDVLSVIWKKVIGGSGTDKLNNILLNNNQLIISGYTNSIDGNLQNISKTSLSDYDGLIVKMDLSGNVLSNITYGGSQSDYIFGEAYINDKLVLAGSSFSLDNDMESFNLGNSDAIMFTIDSNLNVINNFKLETLLMSSSKELIVNYGDSIPTVAGKDSLKLYTTNDATTDLGNWCVSSSTFDSNSNYNFTRCLRPFDEGNIIQLYYGVINEENDISISPISNNNWFYLFINFGNTGIAYSPQINNFKIKFTDTDYLTITEAVSLEYIEPLVLIGNSHVGNYFFPNTYNILSGADSGIGNYPRVYILIKPKNKTLEKISFTSGGDYTLSQAQVKIQELFNFDISLTPNNS
ncbi:MAG: type II secretion system protein [Bacilli bacterium]|nr:type II secretion system protein [Bacilli bacterium]